MTFRLLALGLLSACAMPPAPVPVQTSQAAKPSASEDANPSTDENTSTDGDKDKDDAGEVDKVEPKPDDKDSTAEMPDPIPEPTPEPEKPKEYDPCPPNIVLLQIGTNDTNINLDAANIPKRLDKLLETITKTAPDALVVVAQIVPSRNDGHDQRVQAFNATIPDIVKKHAEAGQHIIHVDMHSAFRANADWKKAYYADDLHPKEAGFDLMAKVWWDAIGKFAK